MAMAAVVVSLGTGVWLGGSSLSVPAYAEPVANMSGKAALQLTAVGDVMLARKVERLINSYGIGYPLAKVQDLLRQADITFGNLESPLGVGGTKLPGKGIWFRANPDSVKALVDGGFDVVSLANNHALDYDTPPFLQTFQVLQGHNILAVGGGKDAAEANRPAIVEKDGVRVAFLAYSEMADIIWSLQYPRMLKATETDPGIAPLVVRDIVRDIKSARKDADMVVVSLHWGVEYADDPTPAQRETAHALVDAGADLILGHHPHTLQGVEIYRNAVIAYSLGNFVFDQSWSDKTEEGLILQAQIGPLGVEEAWLLPVVISEAQPAVATNPRGEKVLAKVTELSRQLGTTLTVDGYRAVLHNELVQ